MAEADRLRTAQWFQTLDPNVQQAFQRIADEQPALVVKVLSNGTVEAPADGAVNLSQLFALSDDQRFKRTSPEYLVLDVVCNPAHPNPGVAFAVTYTVQNGGESASAPRRDAVRIFAQDGTTVVSEKPVDGKPLASGAQEQLTATFEDGVTDGVRYPQVLVNLDGAPYGTAANEHGSQTYANGPSLEVGVYAEQVGPATAGQAYYTDIRTAAEALNVATQYKDAQSLPYVQRGLTALGTALAAGAADFPGFASLSDIATSLTTLAEQAGYAHVDALQQSWPPDMPELIVGLYTAVVPLEALTYDGATLQRYVPPLQERVVAVVQGLSNVR